ncbi:Asparagine synthetase domain-containing protein 1 [Thoreauomyces humboldtii]|nr:Asparagine synthetase domain-containing protein 1 [Thoreauomyces humboldtii]
MCGILVGVFPSSSDAGSSRGPECGSIAPLWNALLAANALRGPDRHSSRTFIGSGHTVTLHGWTLHLRGNDPILQPVEDDDGNILCFNGEIFGGLDVPDSESDTLILSQTLSGGLDKGRISVEQNLLRTISLLEGPWAIVYYQPSEQKLYFGRDFLGRRSLLWRIPRVADEPFLLASVGFLENLDPEFPLADWAEVPADGLYSLDFRASTNGLTSLQDMCSKPTHYPWQPPDTSDPLSGASSLIAPFGRIATDLPSEADLAVIDPACTPINSLPSMSNAPRLTEAVHLLENALAAAVEKRITTIPSPRCSTSARLAVLFSGGLDCICLAALADRFLPPGEPCDLLNVAFENPRGQQAKGRKNDQIKKKLLKTAKGDELQEAEPPKSEPQKGIYDVPDRLTGRAGLAQLRIRYPNRPWRFVEINVPYDECLAARPRILSLMNPLRTEMDLSIAIAFWFAARGVGNLSRSLGAPYEPYHSAAKVLLSGLGADEQLGGYSRHRVAYDQRSWSGLLQELQTDVDRIATRNLGRDDRVASDHGKEIRFPYLAEPVMRTLHAMPVHLKADMRFPRGVGEKMVLRVLCAEVLGLVRASKEPKRAVQFGARSAKMDVGSGAVKGHQVLKAS